jgi:hypothetical protein
MESMGTKSFFATGEHEYTRWGYQQLIEAGVGLLQPDVMWMGGPTEFAKVVALASANGVPVVPHGCGVYGYFMAMAFNECPLAEFMIMSENADAIERKEFCHHAALDGSVERDNVANRCAAFRASLIYAYRAVCFAPRLCSAGCSKLWQCVSQRAPSGRWIHHAAA